jgi:hypothetical protein
MTAPWAKPKTSVLRQSPDENRSEGCERGVLGPKSASAQDDLSSSPIAFLSFHAHENITRPNPPESQRNEIETGTVSIARPNPRPLHNARDGNTLAFAVQIDSSLNIYRLIGAEPACQGLSATIDVYKADSLCEEPRRLKNVSLIVSSIVWYC